MKKFIIIGLIAAITLLALTRLNSLESDPNAPSRPFLMGITYWPPDTEPAEIIDNGKFVNDNTDLNVYHQLGGVPWVEAAQNRIHPRVKRDWQNFKNEFSSRRKTYIALTPLNVERDGMAMYAGEVNDEMPLPSPWSGYKLNSEAVKQAYLNYVLLAIDFFEPDYLAINIETNQYYEDRPEDWSSMLDLHRFIYGEIKGRHPRVIVMPTVQYDHIKNPGAEGIVAAISELAEHADAIGLSTYPYSSNRYSLPDEYFEAALQFNKPVAIAETGFPSATFKLFGRTFEYTEEDQARYTQMLLDFALRNRALFVVLFTGTDFDKLVPKLPSHLQEVAGGYQYDGLRDSARNLKKAYAVWSNYLKMTYRTD